MAEQLPRIAIPEPTSTDAEYNGRSLPQYVRAIEAAGGVAILIPLHETPVAQAQLLGSCSGILLPGSPADVDPRRYGQEPAKETAAPDAAREAADDLLLRAAFDQRKPLLGICYGLQSLNVFRHGTLIQHLPPVTAGGAVNHEPGRDVRNAHPLVVTTGSTLARAVADDVEVNSSHHQAVDRPGEFLRVVAVSPVDGVTEALETTDPERFLVGVQWHPERSYEHSLGSQALFGSFLMAARAWRSAKCS